MKEQLIRKDCTTGEYSDIFPITSISSIKDLSTGKTLDKILEGFNHIYLPFKDNSKTNTRLQVAPVFRKKGLFITYISCKDKVITEYYNSDDFSNKAWGDSKNWVPYVDKNLVVETINRKLSWYKA